MQDRVITADFPATMPPVTSVSNALQFAIFLNSQFRDVEPNFCGFPAFPGAARMTFSESENSDIAAEGCRFSGKGAANEFTFSHQNRHSGFHGIP